MYFEINFIFLLKSCFLHDPFTYFEDKKSFYD